MAAELLMQVWPGGGWLRLVAHLMCAVVRLPAQQAQLVPMDRLELPATPHGPLAEGWRPEWQSLCECWGPGSVELLLCPRWPGPQRLYGHRILEAQAGDLDCKP